MQNETIKINFLLILYIRIRTYFIYTYTHVRKNIKKDNKPIDLLLKMLYIISVGSH